VCVDWPPQTEAAASVDGATEVTAPLNAEVSGAIGAMVTERMADGTTDPRARGAKSVKKTSATSSSAGATLLAAPPAATAPALSTAAAEAPAWLVDGALVEITGMKKRPELNGNKGRVKGSLLANGTHVLRIWLHVHARPLNH
jgi:hypothetical protein